MAFVEWVNAATLIPAGMILLPMVVFCAECLAAMLPGRRRLAAIAARPPAKVAVLIPAHNEAAVIGETLGCLLPTLGQGDRVVVVADNCTDATAEVSRAAGAEVVERFDSARRGKGYALEYGIRGMASDPPDVVVVLDADCRVHERTVEVLSEAAHRTGRPAQALNICEHDAGTSPLSAISALTLHFRNRIRPLGLARLGMPCHLMGTGMALPWKLAAGAPWEGGNLVEDMQLGIDLAIAGYPTSFCPGAGVMSAVPRQERAFVSQRRRWEHGHLRTLLTQVPRLVLAGLKQRRVDLLCMALDLAVPPLSLLMVLWLAMLCVTTVCAAAGASVVPVVLLAGGGFLMVMTILAGWAVFCRHLFGWRTVAALPWYVFRKVPIYLDFLVRRQREWVRTERDVAAVAQQSP